MSQKQTTRKERRIAARKKQILQAAAKVFAEKGFHSSTTKEIAEVADVSEGTIYNYFDSKDNLLMAMISSMAALSDRQAFFDKSLDMDFHEFLTEYSGRKRVDFDEGINDLLAVFPALLSSAPLRAGYNQNVVQPAMEMFERNLKARIEKGQLKPIDDIPLLVRLLGSINLGLWLLLIVGDKVIYDAWKEDPDGLTHKIIELFYDQFMVDKDGTD